MLTWPWPTERETRGWAKSSGAVVGSDRNTHKHSTVDHERRSPPSATMMDGQLPSEVMLSLLSFLRPRELARVSLASATLALLPTDAMWARHCCERWWDECAPFPARPRRTAPGAAIRTTARVTGRGGGDDSGGSCSGGNGKPHALVAGDAADDPAGDRTDDESCYEDDHEIAARCLRVGDTVRIAGLANATRWNGRCVAPASAQPAPSLSSLVGRCISHQKS